MLKLKKITFAYTKEPVIKNINASIKKGEMVSIIGASGCGKSTLLQIIYGLHHVKGTIFWNDQQLLGPNFNLVPGEDFMKYLSQDFNLMPSISVAENVGKYLSNMFPRKKQQRVKELLKLVEMTELATVKAGKLSGGQQQRVALARVLAKPPEILLLDEPFSHIDHFRRSQLRRNVFSYLKENRITCITATHDSTDALSFADRTFAMQNGKIVSRGKPEELYLYPKNAYVASLFGEVNEVPVYIFHPEKEIDQKIILYPHEIYIQERSGTEAIVIRSYFKGSNYLVEAKITEEPIFFENPTSLEAGKKVTLGVKPEVLVSRIKKDKSSKKNPG